MRRLHLLPTLAHVAALALLPAAPWLSPTAGFLPSAALWAAPLLAVFTAAILRLPEDLWSRRSWSSVGSWTAQEPWLPEVLTDLARRARLPVPRLVVFPSPAASAFVSGFVAHPGTLFVSTGLLEALDRAEVTAILGHEMGHIMHRDARHLAVGTTLLDAAILLIGDAVDAHWRGMAHRGLAVLALIAMQIAFACLALIAVMAYRRRCERRADAAAAALAGIQPVRSVLQRLQPDPIRLPDRGALARLSRLWSPHPSAANRLAALAVRARAYSAADP